MTEKTMLLVLVIEFAALLVIFAKTAHDGDNRPPQILA